MARTTIPGAEIGTIVGAAKGAPLEGLGIGSAAGAATGVVWILATRGKDVVLPYGTSLELQLSQPVISIAKRWTPPSRYDAGPMILAANTGRAIEGISAATITKLRLRLEANGSALKRTVLPLHLAIRRADRRFE